MRLGTSAAKRAALEWLVMQRELASTEGEFAERAAVIIEMLSQGDLAVARYAFDTEMGRAAGRQARASEANKVAS
jgi:hypothetical protein